MLAAERLFDVVLCYSPDRLARHYAHQWVLLDELRRVGVEVIFVNQPAAPEGPQGQLFLGIQGLFAEYKRVQITERLRRGKLYSMRQGKLVSPTQPTLWVSVHSDERTRRWALDSEQGRGRDCPFHLPMVY